MTTRALGRALAALASALVVALALGPSVVSAGNPLPAQAVRPLCGIPGPGRARCHALVRTDLPKSARPFPSISSPDATPAVAPLYSADLLAAYGLTAAAASGGSGVKVAVIDAYDDPTAEADMAVYRSGLGLPACTSASGCFTKVDQNGGTSYPAHNAGWAGEIALDLTMVSAICPNCSIILVEANSENLSDLGAGVNRAVAMGATFISNSYGAFENSFESSWDTAWYKHAGVVITASTGDSGYGVQYPAASPYVVSVGGTSLARSGGSWSQSAWSGAGSGCSAYEAKPAWQTDSGCAKRTVADVSAEADPSTGVGVYFNGSWYVMGGTSASAPIVAAAYALAGTPAAGTYPASYPYLRGGLTDVVGGSNGTCGGSGTAYLCQGVVGYDGPTGLGTPAGTTPFTAPSLPGQPQNVTGVASNGSVAVSWDAPASDGGAAITKYTATSSPDAKTCTWSSGPRTCTVTGLTNGTAYTFTVTATNGVGTGSASTASAPVAPSAVPSAPRSVAGTRGDGAVTVTWTAPLSDGGFAITSYTASSSPEAKACTWSSGPLTCTVTGLANGTGYTFTVTATNATGTGPASSPSATVTPAAVPAPPTGVAGTAGNGSVAVVWTPGSNGGATITAYTVTSSPGAKTCTWSGGPTTCTVTGLTNGTGYTFTVTATNVAGTSAPSSPSSGVTPRTVPSQPQNVAGAPGNGSVAVSWSAPSTDGGSPLTAYAVAASPGSRTCSATPPTTSCTVTGLGNGTSYTFTVTATNAAGSSLPSAASPGVTPRTVPGAPTGITAQPGNGSASVAWSAPASDGGAAITHYTVTSSPSGKTCTWSFGPLECTVTGLVNGQAYTFTVVATNAAGDGPASSPSGGATPASLPAAPTGVTASLPAAPTLGALEIAWTDGGSGGSPVTGYSAAAYNASTFAATGHGCAVTGTPPATGCTITGLTPGVAVVVRVTSTTAIGTGLASAPSDPATPPAAPAAAIGSLPTWTLTTTVSVPLAGTAGTNAVAGFDLRYRRAAWNGSFGSFGYRSTAATSSVFTVSPGYTYCFSLKARDSLGYETAAWSPERCTAVPLDDRSLSRRTGWTTGTSSSFYRSTWTRSTRYGATLVRTSVRARRIAIVVTTCSTCGSIRVYWGSTLLRSISLRSSTTVYRKVITVATFSSARSGTLTIKVSTSGRRVYVDGLAIGRT